MSNTFIADFLYSKEVLSLELLEITSELISTDQTRTINKLSETIKFDHKIDNVRNCLMFAIQSHSNFQRQHWLSRFLKDLTENRELLQNLLDFFNHNTRPRKMVV